MSHAFAAFERRDFSAAIDALEPIAGELERIGGSRAQLDLVEFTLLKAYLGADRLDDARRMLSARRPGFGHSRCRVGGCALIGETTVTWIDLARLRPGASCWEPGPIGKAGHRRSHHLGEVIGERDRAP